MSLPESRFQVPLLRLLTAGLLVASACTQQPLPAADETADAVAGVTSRVHKMPMRDPSAFTANNQAAPAGAHLTYYGGKVIQNVKVKQVIYGSGTYIPEVTSSTAPNVGSFYQQVTNSAHYDWLSEYNTASPAQVIGRGSFIGAVTIAPAASRNGATITDAQIQAEIQAQITAGALPAADDNTIYMVNFPSGKSISQGTSSSCSAGGFCAYHGTFKSGAQNVYYGVLPYMGAGSGCATGCGAGTAFNNQTSVASHELIEAVTDAEVGIATVVGPPLAWYDSTNGEIGDICNASQGSIVGTDGFTYTVQQEFSNSSNACITTKTVAADFGVAVSPTSATVAAGGTKTVTVSTSAIGGSTQSITLTATGLPAGVTALFSPASVTAGGSSTMTLTAAAGAAAATATVSVKGTSGTTSHTASLALTVTGTVAVDFSMAVAPSSSTVTAGSATTVTVSTTAIGGSTQSITLTVGGLPAGVTGAFSPGNVTAGGASTLTLTAAAGAAAATATYTVSGASTTSHSATASVTVTAATGGTTALSNGVAVTGLAGATGATQAFVIAVPAGQSSLTVVMSGGTGDADMYVKSGAMPTLTTYDCRPYVSGNAETCTFTNPAAGNWYVMLNGYAAYTGVTLKATYAAGTVDTTPALTNGVAVTGIAGATSSAQYWKLTVPAGQAKVVFAISGGTGDADLYVKAGAKPTTTTYDCRPYLTGNTETCTITAPAAGDYFVMIRGYAAFTGVSLKGTYP